MAHAAPQAWRRLIVVIAVAVLAGCGTGSATVPAAVSTEPAASTIPSGPSVPDGSSVPVPSGSPSAPASHPAAPTPAVSHTPDTTPAPTQTAADAVLAALRIGKPYVLFANPVDTNLAASLALDAAGNHVAATIRGREVLQANALVGYVFVLSYEGVKWTDTLFKEAAKGAANNVGGKVSYTTIGGQPVAMIKVTGGTIAMFSYRETIVMVLGATQALTRALTSSIIKAS